MIAFENAACNYGGGEILSDVSLALAPGSFHFLSGPSGTGKTSLLKLAYAEIPPSRGHVQLFGKDSATMSRDEIALCRRRIGIVHQECQFLDHLTLAQNIALPLTVTGRQVAQVDLDELISWVGLKKVYGALPPTLSGGERQRAALARAIITDPEVILADEPTGNLDWDMSLRLMMLLVELNRMGKTILIATHDLQLIRHVKSKITARVLRIRNRGLEQAGADL